jgi:hypothetical protein
MKATKMVPDNVLLEKGIEILFKELGNNDSPRP